jgi:integrase
VPESLTESALLDYVRFQSAQQPPFSGSTINQRVAVADRALRATFPDAPKQVAPEFQVSYWRRAPMGLGRPMPAVSRLRVREPKRTIVPLSVDDVARFWSSFHTSRDLAIVGLMLLQGLRSQEVRDLNRDDLRLQEAEIRVPGKSNKPRMLPLARPSTREALIRQLRRYLHSVCAEAGIAKRIVPHQLRHTYASEMLRAGVEFLSVMK